MTSFSTSFIASCHFSAMSAVIFSSFVAPGSVPGSDTTRLFLAAGGGVEGETFLLVAVLSFSEGPFSTGEVSESLLEDCFNARILCDSKGDNRKEGFSNCTLPLGDTLTIVVCRAVGVDNFNFFEGCFLDLPDDFPVNDTSLLGLVTVRNSSPISLATPLSNSRSRLLTQPPRELGWATPGETSSEGLSQVLGSGSINTSSPSIV